MRKRSILMKAHESVNVGTRTSIFVGEKLVVDVKKKKDN